MSKKDHREISNALNNYYGNKMNLYEVGSKYREEYRQKMIEQKKLVKELSIKAEAFNAILKSYDEAFSKEHMAGEVSNIIEKYESGDYGAENDEVDYCTKCTVKPKGIRIGDYLNKNHKFSKEDLEKVLDGGRWYTLYESGEE